MGAVDSVQDSFEKQENQLTQRDREENIPLKRRGAFQNFNIVLLLLLLLFCPSNSG